MLATNALGAQQIAPCVASASPSAVDGAIAAGRDGAAFAAALNPCLAAMHEGMTSAFDAASGEPDELFADAMIPHHQGAIDMARQVLVYGRDPELRAFALSVIAEQGAEIEMLRAWSARHRRRARADTTTRARSQHMIDGGMEHILAPVGRGESSTSTPREGPTPVTGRDRVYTGDQVSNTVSVIDPSTDRLLGQIRLGNQRPNILSATYGGQINTHGLGFSPDHRLLAVVSTATNAVTIVETATNRVRGIVYIGRNPHEGFFTPNGRELWVSVRGENYLSVIDPVALREVRRVVTAPGPAMVVFRPDGKIAFVDHSFTPELDVVDVASGRVIRRIPVVSKFSPNLVITEDGSQVWLTHKDVGKVTVVDARTYEVVRVIDTGPVTNHVNFAGPGGGTRAGGASAGDLAYVSVCGENAVKVFRRADQALVTTIAVGACPHGVWPSGDGTKVYVGLQEGDGVDVIDTRTNTKVGEIPIGLSPQAVVYVPNAVPEGPGTANLVPLATSKRALAIDLVPASGDGGGKGTIWIRSLGPVDGIDVSVTGLAPSTTYTLFLRASREADPRSAWPLATIATDATGGTALVESVAPTALPTRAMGGSSSEGPTFVVLRGAAADGPVVLISR